MGPNETGTNTPNLKTEGQGKQGHQDPTIVGSLLPVSGPSEPVTKPPTLPPITKQAPGGYY